MAKKKATPGASIERNLVTRFAKRKMGQAQTRNELFGRDLKGYLFAYGELI